MKKLSFLLAFLSSISLAQGVGSTAPTCIWSGSLASCLPSTGIYLPGQRVVRFGEATANGSNYVALTAPSSLSGDFTATLFAADDTIVGKATTDILTNKTLSGNTATNLVSGSGTFTFNTSGTVTAPNATDTLVGKATTDILTNKSMSGSSNTFTNLPASGLSGTVPLLNGGTGTAAASANAAFNALSPMTTAGDIIYGGASGAGTRLAAGSTTQLLHGGTTPSWSAASLTADVTGVLPIANGGSNKALTLAAGGVLWTDADSFEVSAAGSSNQVLVSNGTSAPSFSLITNSNVDAAAAIAGSKLVAATNAVAGAVTTSAQSFAGAKTFYDGLILDDAAGQSTLAYYREDSISTTWLPNGVGSTASGSFTVFIRRVGAIVNIWSLGAVGTCAGTTTAINTTTDLPSWAYPAGGTIVPIWVSYNGGAAFTVGVLEINTSGNLSLWRDPPQTAFTAGATCGNYGGFSATYTI